MKSSVNLPLNRARARIRRRHPLMGFLGAFVLGQIGGGLPGDAPVVSLLAVSGVVLAAALGGRERVALGAAIFLAGIASTVVTLPRDGAWPAERSWRGEVIDAPRYPRTGEVRFVIKATPVGEEGGAPPARVALCAAVDLPWRNIAGLERGDVFIFRAHFTPLRAELNPFAYPNTLRRRGVSATCRITHATGVLSRQRSRVDRWRTRIENLIAGVVGAGERGGMLVAMSIGARDTLSIATEAAFKGTGTAHLLVVSGFQVTVVYYVTVAIVGWLFSWGWLVRRNLPLRGVVHGLGLLTSLLFVAVAGVDGASLRAALAAIFTVIARALERGGGMVGGIGASMLGLSIVWPGVVLEPGVQLTYAALFGITFGRGLFDRGGGGRLRALTGVTVGVWLFSSIVSLGWFRTFSPLGLIVNPLLAPLVGVVGCHGTFLGLALVTSELDPNGAFLGVVGDLLIVFREVILSLAASGLTLGELSAPVAAMWGGGLLVVSACLLHSRYRTTRSLDGEWLS